jgi:SAM-dependent methyltransferase
VTVRIVSLSMVKNEQDIIEPFIRHNARFIDCMVILDNASVDETRRIATDCARELGTIIVADSDEFAYTQAERMTRLLYYSQTAFFADFVLLLDADEFLGVEDRATLLAMLEAIPLNGVGLLPWQTFLLTPGEAAAAAEDPPRSIRQRRAAEVPLFRKAVLRLDRVYRPDLLIEQGNHGIITTSGERLPTVQLDGLPLLHFPVRSHGQLVAKAIVGWMAYLARNPAARQEDLGSQWRDAFDRVVSAAAAGPDEGELCEISMRYAQDRPSIDWQADAIGGEPPFNYIRRYSTGAFGNPLTLVARSWERSLSSPPALLQLVRSPTATNAPGAASTTFDAAWHWDNLFVDVAPFRFVAEKHRPVQVLDVGCGIGAYLMLFKLLGTRSVLGVDGVPADATVLAGDEYLVRDLSQPLQLGHAFDLVICVEVAEHLATQHSEILLDSVASHAGRMIVFSAAEPGQPGYGHVNCRPISYWLERWASRGWYPDLVDSLGIRCLATMSWFRRNLVVLRRGDPKAGAEAAAALAMIGTKSFTWYNQQPGIRQIPFSEDLPPPPAGYGV